MTALGVRGDVTVWLMGPGWMCATGRREPITAVVSGTGYTIKAKRSNVTTVLSENIIKLQITVRVVKIKSAKSNNYILTFIPLRLGVCAELSLLFV